MVHQNTVQVKLRFRIGSEIQRLGRYQCQDRRGRAEDTTLHLAPIPGVLLGS